MAEPGVAPAAWDSQSPPRDASGGRPALLRGSAFNGWTREWNDGGGSRMATWGLCLPVRSPEVRLRGAKTPPVERREACVLSQKHAAPSPRCQLLPVRLSALRSLTFVRDKGKEGASPAPHHERGR